MAERLLRSSEIFSLGYAVPLYDIVKEVRHWLYRDEQYTLPSGAVPLVDIPGVRFSVARIDDVRRAHG